MSSTDSSVCHLQARRLHYSSTVRNGQRTEILGDHGVRIKEILMNSTPDNICGLFSNLENKKIVCITDAEASGDTKILKLSGFIHIKLQFSLTIKLQKQ